MPNWCTNQLIICGPKTWVDLFDERIKTEEGGYEILNNLYPCPEDLTGFPSRHGTIPEDDPDKELKLSNVEKYGSADWYDWCVTNWGTKWGDCDTEHIESHDGDDDMKVSLYRFDTAWGPPQEGLEYIAKSFKPLLFDLRFQEPGMQFQGYVRIGNGNTISEQVTDYVMDSTYVYDSIEYDYEHEMGKEAVADA